MKASFEEGT